MHVLILGMTESGKTTLAKRLIAEYSAKEISSIVLDPINHEANNWGADYVTNNPQEFLKVYWESKCCAAFFDESADYCGRHDKDFILTATKGRHWGHINHYLAQRGTLISNTVRDQCGRIFLFASSLNDCKTHADEWNCPEFLKVPSLPKGTCYTKTRFGEPALIKLF